MEEIDKRLKQLSKYNMKVRIEFFVLGFITGVVCASLVWVFNM